MALSPRRWIQWLNTIRVSYSFPHALLLGTLVAASLSCTAQETAQDQQIAQPSTLDTTLATLHGMVRNAATGEGLPRALVRIEGDANSGVLTDGDGRFEFTNISVGPQQVEVSKPGYIDRTVSGAGTNSTIRGLTIVRSVGHNILVAAQMPDVVFTMFPTGAIRGYVELSTGDAASGIAVNLAQRTIQDGRLVWQQAASTRTRNDGSYRFGLLDDGDYAVYSQPSMASDLDGVPGGVGQRMGYAPVFYADAREPSGASRIHVASGQESQANLTLTLEPFHAVTAAFVFPPGAPAGLSRAALSGTVLDSAGRPLPYPVQSDQESHSVQVELPDGAYTLLLTSAAPPEGRAGAEGQNAGVLAGSTDVTVAGRAVSNLRIVLAVQRPSAVQLTLQRNVASSRPDGPITILASSAEGWVDDGMINELGNGSLPGPLQGQYLRPGSYWVHTHNQRTLCETSFTAGGANLAREPMVLGLGGSMPPMELTMRDDCASLQLSLPETASSVTAGEEPFYTVYAVPDFDSTADVQPVTLRATTGGTSTLSGLTPGNYHVYTFVGEVQLAYRNSDAITALRNAGQAIALAPGASANLVVEVPQP